MFRKIIYIINPIAGTRTKKDLQDFIEKQTIQKKIPYLAFPSVASGDYSFLLPIITEEKITDIVIAGGDGTINQVLSCLLKCNVNFGIIPCGSGNGLALAAKIPKQPVKALDVIFNGKPSFIDGFYVNERFACMLCGVGFDAKVAHEFANQQKRGLATYARLVAKNFFNAGTYPFTLQCHNQEFSTDAYFISIANSNQFGNQVTIAPKALLSDGLLDIVIVKKTIKPLLLYNLLKQIFTGKPQQLDKSVQQPVLYFQAEKISISNSEEAPIHIDGDPVETSRQIEIAIKKNSFRLIQPV